MGFYNAGGAITDPSQIVSTTKPTTRDNGDALVTGDRWYKDDDQTEWFWNGTYWLSPLFTVGNALGFTSIPASNNNLLYAYLPNWKESSLILIRTFGVSTKKETGTYDASNNWEIQLSGGRGDIAGAFIDFSVELSGVSTSDSVDVEIPLNTALTKGSGEVREHLYIRATKTGSPPNIFNFCWWATLSFIYP